MAGDVKNVLVIGDGGEDGFRGIPCTKDKVRGVLVSIYHPSAFVNVDCGTLKYVIKTSRGTCVQPFAGLSTKIFLVVKSTIQLRIPP